MFNFCFYCIMTFWKKHKGKILGGLGAAAALGAATMGYRHHKHSKQLGSFLENIPGGRRRRRHHKMSKKLLHMLAAAEHGGRHHHRGGMYLPPAGKRHRHLSMKKKMAMLRAMRGRGFLPPAGKRHHKLFKITGGRRHFRNRKLHYRRRR
jgi:hypothetical protein